MLSEIILEIKSILMISNSYIPIGLQVWILIMLEYLSLLEIRSRTDHIRAAFDALWQTKSLIGKPQARQWQFFQAIFERLMLCESSAPFTGVPAARTAQWKFEVEDKLRRFYLRRGGNVDYIFTIAHKSELAGKDMDTPDAYPDLQGYCLLVRDVLAETANNDTEISQPQFLERVIAEAIDAEFRAYMALPEIKVDELEKWFVVDSPAMREIVNILLRHAKRGWVVSNPMNPSTKRLLSVKIKSIKNGEAHVNTMEYWYLKWWDQKIDAFVYPYRETNRQMYILKRDKGAWRVYENLRPLPRTSRMLRRDRRANR